MYSDDPAYPAARAVAYASSPERTSVLACRPEPYPLSRQALRAVSLDQCLIRDALASHGGCEAIQPRQRMILDVTLVQPEGELIDVPAKMLRAGVMVDSDETALKDRENALDAVRGYAAANELTLSVIDGAMLKEQAIEAVIRSGFVGVDSRTDFNPVMDFALDRADARIGYGRHNRASTPLAHSENRSLADTPTPGVELLVFVLVPFDSPGVSFIDFDNSAQLIEFRTAGFAEPVEHEPRRLLGNADFLGELHRRNTLSRRNEQVHRVEPLMERDVAALEDRAGADREVFPTGVATVEASLAGGDAFAGSADRAAGTIWPETPLKILPSRLLIGNQFEQLEGADS